MHNVDFIENDTYEMRVGDLCGNLYIPVVLPGRYLSNVEDIENLLDSWIYLKCDKKRKKQKGKKKKKKKSETDNVLTSSQELEQEQVQEGEKECEECQNVVGKIARKQELKQGKDADVSIRGKGTNQLHQNFQETMKENENEDENEKYKETKEKIKNDKRDKKKYENERKERDKVEEAKLDKEVETKNERKNDREKKLKCKDLYLFSVLFKNSLFSSVLFKSKYENSVCAWQTFWCAWIDVFKRSMIKDNIYEKKYKENLIEFQVGCIYLLFLLCFSQYVKCNHHTYPIYLAPDTVNLCLDVTEKCEILNKFVELRFILNFLFDTNSVILSCNERITEAFQDRYGFPLYLERGKLIEENSTEIADVQLENFGNTLVDKIENANKACNDKSINKKRGTMTSSYVKFRLEQIRKLLNDI